MRAAFVSAVAAGLLVFAVPFFIFLMGRFIVDPNRSNRIDDKIYDILSQKSDLTSSEITKALKKDSERVITSELYPKLSKLESQGTIRHKRVSLNEKEMLKRIELCHNTGIELDKLGSHKIVYSLSGGGRRVKKDRKPRDFNPAWQPA